MKSTEVEKRLGTLFSPAIEAEGLELYHLEKTGSHGRTVVRVYVDGPEGVTIDDLAKISRSLGVLIDVEDPVKERYNLEVSSPGINRPLAGPEHFRKSIGEQIQVKTYRPVLENRKNFVGILTGFEDDPPRITLQVEKDELSISLDDIVKANIDFPFDAAYTKR